MMPQVTETAVPVPIYTIILSRSGGYMGRLVEDYIAERVAKGELNGGSPKVTRSVLNSFVTHCAGKQPDAWCERDVESWIANTTLRPATRRSMVTKLKPFIRWLVARDHIPKDFTAILHAPKVPEGMPRHLEADQVRALVKACKTTRDRLIILLMVHLGLRRVEVSRIDLEDVDFRERLVSIRGKNGRGEITRVLPITEEVHAALTAYLAEHPAFAGPLIRGHLMDRRFHVNDMGDLITDLMLSVGIKKAAYDGMSAHALRHTCAQELIDAGTDIRLVQSALGHRSVQTTENYLRRKPPGLAAAMAGRKYA